MIRWRASCARGTVRAARYAIARSIEIASTSAARARRTVKRGRYYGRPQAHQPAYRRPGTEGISRVSGRVFRLTACRSDISTIPSGYLSTQYAEQHGLLCWIQHLRSWPRAWRKTLEGFGRCWDGTDTRMNYGEFSPMVQILNALLRSRFRLQGDAPVSVGVLQTGGEFFERVATFWRDGFTLRSACCSNRCSKRACILAHLEQLFDAVSALTGLASTLVSGQAARA